MLASVPSRLAVGALALVLPLAALAGCGAEKKRTVKAEFASAQTNLENSKAASFTLRFDDSKGAFKKLVLKEDPEDEALAEAVLGGSITYVADPAGDRTLKSVKAAPGTSADDIAAQLKDVNVAFVVRDDKAALAELRIVGGVLYVHVDVDEIGRLAEANGVEDFDAELDDFIASAGPKFEKGLRDIRDGKWVKLDVADYIEQFQDLAEGFTGVTPPSSQAQVDAEKLGKDLFAAVKPHVTVTDANDDSSKRLLDVKVDARPALKAALAVLKADRTLPFAGMLEQVTDADVDRNVKEGQAKGTVTLEDGHLTQVTVDIESIRLFARDPGDDSVAGTSVVLDVDDSADPVAMPDDVSAFDVGALIDELLQGFSEGLEGVESEGFSYSG